MKKIILLILVLSLGVFAFTACASETEEAEIPENGSEEEITEEDTDEDVNAVEGDRPLEGEHLTVAMSANYKYFETVTVDGDGNETYEGLDIDILDKLSENLGFTYEISNMPFASLIGSLQSDQADFVISGMSYTDERAGSVDFSDEYAAAKIGVLTTDDSDLKIPSDLRGKRVACSAGTNYEQIIKNIEDAELVTFDGQAAVTQEVLMGRVDAAITGATACKSISEENEGLTYFIIDDEDYDIGDLDTYNMAFPKGSELVPIFNEEIANLKADGTINDIISKWLGEDYLD